MVRTVGCVFAFLFLTAGTVSCQEADSEEISHITPTLDEDSPSGVYIPENLEDALVELRRMLHPKLVEKIREGSEEDLVMHHFGLGLWLRNNWGLWGDSRLQQHFNDLGIFHPDDMSSIILHSLWRSLNNQPLGLEERLAFYKAYWEHNTHPEVLMCPDHQAPIDIRRSKSVSEDPQEMRVLHWGECEKEGEIWVYELRKGLYLPDEETLRLMHGG